MQRIKDSVEITRYLTSPIISVHVGSPPEIFSIHKDLICHTSPYFKAAFTSGFQESNTGIITLPETSIVIFELFLGWLYTREIPGSGTKQEISKLREEIWRAKSKDKGAKKSSNANENNTTKPISQIKAQEFLMHLLELYVFADMILVPDLKNQCLQDYEFYRNILVQKPDGLKYSILLFTMKALVYIKQHTREADLVSEISTGFSYMEMGS